MKPKRCNLCNKNSKNALVVANKIFGDKSNKRKFYHCFNCDVRFMYPPLSHREEIKFYKKEFEKFMYKRSGLKSNWLKPIDHLKSNKETFERRFDYLKPIIKKKNSILEIGCSSGFMLKNLMKKGFNNCFGIEPSGIFSEFLKKQKISTYKNFEEIKNNNQKFDIIMHFFVLEHVQKPLKFLNDQLNHLNKNGKIIFEIPNVADPLHSVFKIKEFEDFYWSIAHPWYFSEKSLRYLIKNLKKKFKLKFFQRYDLSNHFFWATQRKPGGMHFFKDLWGEEFENEYKKKLVEKKICDTLVGVIYK